MLRLRLFSGEFGFSFLDEGLHPFAGIVAAAQGFGVELLQPQRLVERQADALMNRIPRRAHCQRAVRGNAACDFQRAIQQPGMRHNMADQPPAQRRRCINRCARQDHLHRHAIGQGAGQALGAASPRQDAATYLGQAEFGMEYRQRVEPFFENALKNVSKGNAEEVTLEVAQQYLLTNNPDRARQLCEKLATEYNSLNARKLLYRLYQRRRMGL